MKRIIITGATGLIGSKIADKLISRGEEVVVFTRSPKKAKEKIKNAHSYVKWDYNLQGGWQESIIEVDAVIHLAGENVMGNRWNEKHKKKVMESRKIGTQNLVEAICNTKNKCKTFVCASAIGFYNNDINIVVDEDSPAGNDFLADVTSNWEKEAAKVEKCNVRRVSIRIGIVLSKEGGALEKMLTPFKFFVGGPIGSGKQWVPWIHIDDVVNLFIYSLDTEIKGSLNAVSPNPVTMNTFAKTIGKFLDKPAFFKVPEFLLNIVLGDAAKLITRGSRVLPKKTISAGYKFKYENLEKALNDILKE
jgi:uncharacterized protein (TIGR01777 family)